MFIGGRLAWATISDIIGSRKTFMIFTFGSIPIYMYLPTLVETIIGTGEASNLPLYTFCAGTTLAVSIMGGVFSVLPAYEADLYGAKFVGAIHGRMLLGMSAASIAGKLSVFVSFSILV